ncbi:hypothetical protein [Limosilactobacillus reuteri]|uniref:hypothetical protein n=1 Tax=Limosilactobacillus reuteri TaxID=1598 RepID=UPI0024BB94A7|nr:hypothetical protein [Limosilactobacillus reuteri]
MYMAYHYDKDGLLDQTLFLDSNVSLPDNSTLISPFSLLLKTKPKWIEDHWEESGIDASSRTFPTTSTTEQLSQLALQMAQFEKKHEAVETNLKAQIAQLSGKTSGTGEGATS